MDDMITFENQNNFSRKPNKVGTFFKRNWGQILVIVSLIILAVSVLYPLFVLLIRSLKTYEEDLIDPYGLRMSFRSANYADVWPYLQDAFVNSIVTTVCVTIGTVICASLFAFAYVRFNFPGKKITYFLVLAIMMIPGILTLITRYQMINDMSLMNTYSGIIFPSIAGYIPSSFVLLVTFFAGIPKDLFEAAEIDGASDFKTYASVVAPLSKPILWTIGIQTFVGQWNDYLWAKLILANDEWKTLPVYLTELDTATIGWPVAFAGYVISSLPLVILFVAAGKQFISGMTSGAVKM